MKLSKAEGKEEYLACVGDMITICGGKKEIETVTLLHLMVTSMNITQ